MSEAVYSDYIGDILQSIQYILDFTGDMKFEAFKDDVKTQFAIIRCFEMIGEAVKRMDQGFRDKYPFIPWKIIAGMRDRLIHEYDVVDVSVLWRTVQDDIPGLLQKIKDVIKAEGME